MYIDVMNFSNYYYTELLSKLFQRKKLSKIDLKFNILTICSIPSDSQSTFTCLTLTSLYYFNYSWKQLFHQIQSLTRVLVFSEPNKNKTFIDRRSLKRKCVYYNI